MQEGLDEVGQDDPVRRVPMLFGGIADILDGSGDSRGYTRVEVQRTRTVPENLTLNERDQIFFEMTEALMSDLRVRCRSISTCQNVQFYPSRGALRQGWSAPAAGFSRPAYAGKRGCRTCPRPTAATLRQ